MLPGSSPPTTRTGWVVPRRSRPQSSTSSAHAPTTSAGRSCASTAAWSRTADELSQCRCHLTTRCRRRPRTASRCSRREPPFARARLRVRCFHSRPRHVHMPSGGLMRMTCGFVAHCRGGPTRLNVHAVSDTASSPLASAAITCMGRVWTPMPPETIRLSPVMKLVPSDARRRQLRRCQRGSDAADGNGVFTPGGDRVRGDAQLAVRGGVDHAGAYRVDPDAAGGEFDGQGAHERQQRSLRGANRSR